MPPPPPTVVKITLDANQVAALKKAFPDLSGNIQNVAETIATIMLAEATGLLSGQKRYLSLSHQYIEWLEQIYTKLLPDEEYTYDRLSNQFQFPPGTAAYMARVLRSRQNSTIHDKAVASLKSTLKAKQPQSGAGKPSGPLGLLNLRLTHREHGILVSAIDSILATNPTSTVQQPAAVSGANSPMFIGVTILNRDIPDILTELNDKYP